VTDSEATMPVVLFDGRCGFCTWSVDFARKYVRARAHFLAYQTVDLDQFPVSREQCETAVQWVDDSGVSSGALAVGRILGVGSGYWPLVGRVVSSPAILSVSERVYRFIARHRGRLWGVAPAISD